MKQTKGDLPLKVLSVLIAIGLWFYVVQIQSPDIERTIKGVPVVFTQKAALEEKGLILLNDKEHTMDIKIKGKRKYVVDVNSTNLTVLADVSSIDETGTHTVFTNIILPYGNLEVVNKSPTMLTVDVDNLVTVEKEIQIKVNGEPRTDYIVGNITKSQETVSLKGPKSIIDGIQTVSAEIDVNGKDADIEEKEVPIKTYGSNEKEIKSSYITPSAQTVEVRCEILKTKLVDIVPVLAEDLQEGKSTFQLDTNSVKRIRIAGARDVIDTLSAVQTKPIPLSAVNEDGDAAAELELPVGIRSLDGEKFTFRFTQVAAP